MICDISYGPEREQVLDLYLPVEKDFDVFVYFHGGGLEGGDKQEGSVLAEYLTNQGVAVISANYRMYPAAVFPEFAEDAAQVVAWAAAHMPEYGQVKRLFVGGSSAGGYLSMLLCFDSHYLKDAGVDSLTVHGYIHDAGQPTSHFNVLRERNTDPRRVIVDETAPLFFVGTKEYYPPMKFIVSDQDMPGRLEQIMLMVETMKHFGHSPELKLMHGTHCSYICAKDDYDESILGREIAEFIVES